MGDTVRLDLALVDRYVHERTRLGELSPASAIVTRSTLGQMADFLGVRELSTVTRTDIESWLVDRKREPSTIKSMMTKAHPFFVWCLQHDLVMRDPMVGMRAPRQHDGLPRCLEPIDVAAVLAECPDNRGRLVVILMVQCALRIGEVAALMVRDVDLRRRVAAVRGKGGRGKVTRTVPLPAEAVEHLRRQIAGRRDGPVIVSYQPPYGPVSAHHLGKLVARWMTEAGVKHDPYDGRSAHAFRHTTAQELVDAGHDPRVVQRLLGHRSMRTTEGYLRRDPPGMHDALEGRRYGD
jgi:integrase